MTTIGPIASSLGASHAQVLRRAEAALEKSEDATKFTDRMTDALDNVAKAQNQTAELTRAFEMGTEHDLSKVMVSQQVSSLGFQLTLNVRNKVLSAYKDIMNMPV